jgi:hypothetical protein
MVVVGGLTACGPSNDVHVIFVRKFARTLGGVLICSPFWKGPVLNVEVFLCLQMLHLSRMTWSELGTGGSFANGKAGNLKAVTPVATPGQLPMCRGHSLVSSSPFPPESVRFICYELHYVPMLIILRM